MAGRPLSGRIFSWKWLALLSGLAVIGTPRAAASNVFNVYVGASYARSTLRARDSNPLPFSGSGPLDRFDRSDSGYQLSFGVRALELLGAEFDYFDLGSGSVSHVYSAANGPGAVTDATLAQRGEAAFAMLYLPVPVVDVYLKAGVDRITSELSAQFTPQGICTIGIGPCATQVLRLHAASTGLAYGAGAQWKLGDWGVRAEYERFSALGEHPGLVSVGVTWTIL